MRQHSGSSPKCMARAHHSMPRIDGSNRSLGLPSRRLRPAWAASAVRAFAARRRERQLSAPAASRMLRLAHHPSARRRTLLRAARGLVHSSLAKPATCKNRALMLSSDRALNNRCGPRKVREQFNNSRCAPRYAGCRARCPKADKNCFSERVKGGLHTRGRRDDGCDP